MSKSRKVRSDIQVGNLEKKLGLEPGAIRNPNGKDARSDKTLGALRKDFANKSGNTTSPRPGKSIVKSADQQIAAKRTVKIHPKASTKIANKVSSAIKKTSKK